MHENPIYTEVNDQRYPQTVGRITLPAHHGMLTDPVEVEQAMHDQSLQEAELKKASEIAAAGKEYWDAVMQGAIDFLSGGMMSTPKPIDEGRRKPVKIENLRGEKPGWEMAEGTNWWSVNEEDPYWQTKEGYDEGVALYGMKPSFLKAKDVATLIYNPKTGKYDPIKKEEFAEIKPTKRKGL